MRKGKKVRFSIALSLFFTAITFLFHSCATEKDGFRPKPKGYHRLELPAHAYQPLSGDYPYTFQYSQHAVIYPDTSFRAEPYGIEVHYPDLNCTISVSYKAVKQNEDSLALFFNNSHRLTGKHIIRATAIEDHLSITPKGYTAVISELEGDVPSHLQFFVTDSTEHFLRAALYFPSSTKNDSLAPVIDYVKIDMIEMLNSADWQPIN